MQGAGDVSVEEILASIKRVIARDTIPPPIPVAAPAVVPAAAPHPSREPVEPADAEEAGEVLALAEDDSENVAAVPKAADGLAGSAATDASRAAFASLQALTSGHGGLDLQVQQLLRPMLAEWLDAHLPTIVDRLVRAEIARITGTNG
ncbi:DUF2497 domain-containing protein [Croceibacterium sp. TMG7-5b_MA50]|uniref:DUF2497 domain-containing protein n=1 Tax=Croceibacterium sp. TMG7-5b_MA50 TaxID=3121290 RepID=UPI003221ED59